MPVFIYYTNGGFYEEENAKAFSGELKAQGGGAIYNDGFYRNGNRLSV